MTALRRIAMHVIIIFLFMALNIKPTVWYVNEQNKNRLTGMLYIKKNYTFICS